MKEETPEANLSKYEQIKSKSSELLTTEVVCSCLDSHSRLNATILLIMFIVLLSKRERERGFLNKQARILSGSIRRLSASVQRDS